MALGGHALVKLRKRFSGVSRYYTDIQRFWRGSEEVLDGLYPAYRLRGILQGPHLYDALKKFKASGFCAFQQLPCSRLARLEIEWPFGVKSLKGFNRSLTYMAQAYEASTFRVLFSKGYDFACLQWLYNVAVPGPIWEKVPTKPDAVAPRKAFQLIVP